MYSVFSGVLYKLPTLKEHTAVPELLIKQMT